MITIPLSSINFLDEDKDIIIEENSNNFMKYYDINRRYKLGEQRLNYSYKNEIKEIYNVMDCYEANNVGYITQLKSDIEVFSDCFNESCKKLIGENTNFNYHKLLGETQFYDYKISNGTRISNVGWAKLPNNMVFNENIYSNNKSLFYNSNRYFEKYDIDMFKETLESKNIKNELSIGDTVDLCLENKVNVNGSIIDINDDEYIINIDNSEELENLDENNNLRINKGDKQIQISKIKTLNDMNCFSDNANKFITYYYDKSSNISKEELELYLKKIVPDFNSLLDNIENNQTFTSLSEFDEHVYRYGYFLDNVTFNNFKKVRKILNDNNKLKLKVPKIKKEYGENTNFVKEKSNFQLVNNFSLDNLSNFYGEYPYFNNKLDSESLRLKWINGTYDFGYLFFRIIVSNINKKFLENKDSKIQLIETKLKKLNESKDKLNSNIQDQLSRLGSQNKCSNLRLVKTYTSLWELKKDDNNIVKIEEDKIIEGEVNDNVQPGHYALLIEEYDKKKIFKRIRLSNGNEIWVIEKDLKMDLLIESYKDFCMQQGMGIDEIDTKFFRGNNICRYSEFYKKCLPVKIINLKHKLDDNELIIKELQTNLDHFSNYEKILNDYEKEIMLLKHDLESEKNKNLNKDLYFKEIAITKNEDEELYKELYYKIDKYLENIKSLPFHDYYKSLSVLIDKYGRKSSEIDGENPDFIYCRLGKKQLVCKHHNHMIDSVDKLKTYNKAIKDCVDEYGIETDGYIWCKNCGEEIVHSEYETLEEFLGSGARNITHELIEKDEEYKSEDNSEMVETLRKLFIEGDDKSIKSDSLSIIKIISVITNVMGIKISNKDEISLIKICDNLEKTNIKSKNVYIQSARIKQKKASISLLEKAYENYRIRNIILFTASNLFLYLQSAVPEYNITKSFSNCKPSLNGYPLDKQFKFEGVDYIVCILESLSSLGVDWSSLKKIKLKDNLIKTIDQMFKDDLIQYRYSNKKKYLQEKNLEKKEDNNKYVWNEFRPPLDSYSVALKQYRKFNIEPILNELSRPKKNTTIYFMINNFYENERLLSLKLIEEIDEQILENNIETPKFDPTPLDNSCCLQTINSSYNYISYFYNKNKNIKTIIDLLYDFNIKKRVIHDALKISSIYIQTNEDRSLITFNKEIGINDEDLTNEHIKKLYVRYINEGFFEGHKHMYENNICLLTGEHKNDIGSKNYRKTDYYSLVNKINQQKLFSIDSTVYKIMDDQLSFLIDSNEYLQNSKYLNNFNRNIKTTNNKKKLWEDLNDQIKTEVDLIVSTLKEKLDLSLSETDNIKTILLNLGEKNNIKKDDSILMNEDDLNNKFFIDKVRLIQSFMLTYLKNTLFKIKNKKEIIDPYVPEEWKLNKIDGIEDKYKNIIQKNNSIYKKYFTIYDSNQYVFNEMIRIVNGTTNNVKLIKGNILIKTCDLSNKNKIYIYKNIASLLHYIFVYTLYLILNINSDENENVEMENTEFILKNTDYEDDEYDISKEIKKTSEIESQIVKDIIMMIDKDISLLDKHTTTYIKQRIEKKSETEKEDNLKFIQELDKETWGSLKTMIKFGMDTWKNLSNKNRDLYIPPTDIGDNENILTSEDKELNNRLKAQAELGTDINEEDYQQWKDKQLKNQQENTLTYEEREIMSDDDGDES